MTLTGDWFQVSEVSWETYGLYIFVVSPVPLQPEKKNKQFQNPVLRMFKLSPNLAGPAVQHSYMPVPMLFPLSLQSQMYLVGFATRRYLCA